ncbi:helix-turn-helix domain-containing protein [Paraburkholderia madseniana]|uniref:helix-turn-helix domain-containing protein n=1 Tax=Paraburkholderia madseniana TaxID=2599607 RepID=UPI0038B87A73
MTTTNKKGRNPGKDATQDTTTKVNHKDMSAAAQRQRVLEYLRASPQTTYSLRARGISHPAQRVKELIARGYQIASHPVMAVDSDGYMHCRVARYSLEHAIDLVDKMQCDSAHVEEPAHA